MDQIRFQVIQSLLAEVIYYRNVRNIIHNIININILPKIYIFNTQFTGNIPNFEDMINICKIDIGNELFVGIL